MFSEDEEIDVKKAIVVCECGAKAEIPQTMWGHRYKCAECNRPIAILNNGCIIRRIK
jgi:hypothetical protein